MEKTFNRTNFEGYCKHKKTSIGHNKSLDSQHFKPKSYDYVLKQEKNIGLWGLHELHDNENPILPSSEIQFNKLAINWKRETMGYSTMFHKTVNNNYLGIIGMGFSAVPFILKDLQSGPEHWFIALKAITKENPVPKENMGNLSKMAKAWVDWGKSKKII